MTKTAYPGLVFVLFASFGFGVRAPSEEAGAVKAQECLRKAFEAARAIKEPEVQREFLEEIGRDQACAGDLAGARRVVEASEDAKGAAMVLAAIAKAQAKRGDRDAAKATLAEAAQRADQVRARDRRDPFFWIVDACVAAGELDEALRTASRYLSEFYRCDAKVRVAKAHLAAGRHEEAKALVREVAETYWANVDDFNFLSVREWLWPLYLQVGEVAEALQFARAIPARHYDRCRALCAIGEHQAKAGDAKAAAATFAEAFEAARGIEGGGPVAENHMQWVVRAQVHVGDLGAARKTLQRMPDCYHKAVAFEAVATAQAKAGDRAAARSTVEQAIGMAQRMQDEDSKAPALTLLAQCQAEIGERTAAKDTAAKAFQAACQVDDEGSSRALWFAEVAEVQALIGDRTAVQKTLEEALRRAREVRDSDYRSEEVRQIANAQIATGFPKEARATVRELLLPLIASSGPGRDGCGDAARLLAEAGDFAGGYEMARKVGEGVGCRATAVRTVAACHAMAKGPEEPLALADKENDPVLRSSMYHGIAVGLLKARGVEAPSFWLIAPDD
jgi:tetratricopeptide (TPR) repeat protein